MREFLRLACSRSVVRRAARTAGIVSVLLIAINHGDAILRGDVSARRVFQMCLTVLVPYSVSTTSSVLALLSAQKGEGGPAA